jgi:hypothetical protein
MKVNIINSLVSQGNYDGGINIAASLPDTPEHFPDALGVAGKLAQ